MSAPEVNLLFHAPIADHSFSADRQLLAVTRDTKVQLYKRTGSKGFTLQDELSGHDKTVTAVDIAPHSGKIVTCSQDRNAYVWTLNAKGVWEPTLVLLRLNRAATSVRWSPDESKFAVGSGARAISICYFELENDWWVSKHLKKPIRSTILSVAWHPNSVLLAAGSADAHARVFSAFIKGVDQRPEPSAWGARLPFNTVCGEFVNASGGWVHDVSFSPSGNALGFVAHDSSVTVVYPSEPEQPPKAIVTVTTQGLPFMSLLWQNENTIVAAGYDCHPVVFQGDESGWGKQRDVDDPKQKDGDGEERTESARDMFRQMDLKGRSSGGISEDTTLKTIHQNSILKIRAYEGEPGAVSKISTCGIDGRVVVFPI